MGATSTLLSQHVKKVFKKMVQSRCPQHAALNIDTLSPLQHMECHHKWWGQPCTSDTYQYNLSLGCQNHTLLLLGVKRKSLSHSEEGTHLRLMARNEGCPRCCDDLVQKWFQQCQNNGDEYHCSRLL